MPVIPHDSLPVREVPRIKTRLLVDKSSGARATAVWEQWIDADGHIPLHYHDVEEILVILDGRVMVSLDEETRVAIAPSTILVPAGQLHGLRPADSSRVHLLAFFPDAAPRIFARDGTERPLPWQDIEGGERPP